MPYSSRFQSSLRKDETAIMEKYAQLGESAGFLGSPTTNEAPCPDSPGHFRHYQNGSIYWSPKTGAHEIHGAIKELWSSMGWERSFLGYPTTDEERTPHGNGRYNHFEGGSIYWTAETGAHEVHGDARTRWSETGWEQGPLGYPVTSEFRTFDLATPDVRPKTGNRLRISAFQHGFIAYSEDDRDTHVVVPSSYRGITLMVTPIFWGTQWNPGNPASPGQAWPDIDNALSQILNAGVTSGLQQYGIAGVVKTNAVWMQGRPVPANFDQARGGFTRDQLQEGLIDAVFHYGASSPMHEKAYFENCPPLTTLLSVYLIFLPNGTRWNGDLVHNGYHFNFGSKEENSATLSRVFTYPNGPIAEGDDIKICFVEMTTGGLNSTLSLALHELVEAADDAATIEIGDRCDGNDGFDETVAGVTLRSYWSNFHNRCILPPVRDPRTDQVPLQ